MLQSFARLGDLGGTAVLPVVMSEAPARLQAVAPEPSRGPDGTFGQGQGEGWQSRRAGLLSFGLLSEGCRKEMKKHLDTIVSKVSQA